MRWHLRSTCQVIGVKREQTSLSREVPVVEPVYLATRRRLTVNDHTANEIRVVVRLVVDDGEDLRLHADLLERVGGSSEMTPSRQKTPS